MKQRSQSSPPLVFCASAPSETKFLVQWEKHLHPLQQANHITIWSKLHLMAGAPTQQIHNYLDQSDFIVLLISTDFLDNDECVALMERAIQRTKESDARLIPLLLSPVAWRETELASFRCIPSNNRPVTLWSNRQAGFDECVRYLRSILGRPVTGPLQKRASEEEKNRERMLGRLRLSYSDLISDSLQGATWLELSLTDSPAAVQNVPTLLLRASDRPEQPLSPGTSIIEVYDKAEQELLILGEPGSGKSTLLLNLAEHLVVRAKQDKTLPLPVILLLSSWATKRLPLQDWIVEQLVNIYNVPRKLSVRWTREDGILPLLDGFDEMEETARPACIAAINIYHRDHPSPLVVCSRTTESRAATDRHRLTLHKAIVVQPLTYKQVDTYLVQAGMPLEALRNAIKKDSGLRELATTPLLLNIMICTYQGKKSVSSRSKKGQELRRQVLSDFIQRMVTEKGKNKGQQKLYPFKDTCLWLSWLAQQMQDHIPKEFYFEHLQFDWLPIGQQRVYIWLAVQLPSILIGVFAGLFVTLFLDFPLSFWYTTIASLIQNGILGGFLGGLFSGEMVSRALPQSVQGYSHRNSVTKRIAISIFIGLAYGLSFGVFLILQKFGLSQSPDNYKLHDWIRDGSISSILTGLSCWFLLRLSFPQWTWVAPPPVARIQPRFLSLLQSLLQTLHRQRIFLLAATVGGTTVLSQAFSDGLRDGLSIGLNGGVNIGVNTLLILGPNSGLVYGSIIVLIRLILTKQAMNIEPIDRLEWPLGSLLRSLGNRTHLRITLFLTLGITMIFGLARGASSALGYALDIGQTDGLGNGIESLLSKGLIRGLITGLSTGLGYGLSIGLIYWLLQGLLEGVERGKIDNKDRHKPNQGIRDSLRNSLRIGCVSVLLIGVSLCLGVVLSIVLPDWLKYGESLGEGLSQTLTRMWSPNWVGKWLLIVCCACSGGLLIAADNGGQAVLRHIILRFLLWRTHTFPWRAPQFLDDAKDRFFLKRVGVGGGYMFIHRVLQNHFADLRNAPPSTQPTNPSPP